MDAERRDSARTPTNITVELTVDDEVHSCDAIDLGAGGIRLRNDSVDMSVGEQVYLAFDVPDHDVHVEAEGVVLHITRGTVGIEFTDIDPDAVDTIERWVETHGILL